MAARLEREGLSVALVNPRFVKPMDRDTVERFGRSCGLIVTFEDHVLAGGFGSAVLETLNAAGLATPLVRIGWPDEFIEHGRVDSRGEKYGVSVAPAMELAAPVLAGLQRERLIHA